MQALSKERWLAFLTWLGAGTRATNGSESAGAGHPQAPAAEGAGVSGIHPLTLRLTLGPIAALLPLARQVARELHPWLLALLAERQRRGLAQMAASTPEERGTLEQDSSQQPYRRREAQHNPRWLGWLLAAELLRLTRLAEAPEAALYRREWLAWEVRYWALAVSLARVGQLYAALAARQGREAAAQALEEALALAWSQATEPAQAA